MTVPPPSTALASAPTWRREPYRLLFPLGVLLAWWGVGHWLLVGLFGIGSWSGVFHSIAQIQGFLMAFACGFLYTAVPRRTQTWPPAPWEMAVALAAPPATTACAALGALALAQACWGVLMLTLLAFCLRRFLARNAGRRPPDCFLWVPLSFVLALAGAGAIGAQRGLGPEWFWLHDLGQKWILQGLFVGLIVGLGGMVLPLLTRGEAPPDASSGVGSRLRRTGHFASWLGLAGSFVLETRGAPAIGYAVRAGLTLALLLGVARLHRPPCLPGLHRRLIWASAWCLPLGYAFAALDPGRAQAGLHVVFIGGFAALALGVGLHVTLAHGGYQGLVRKSPWQVGALGALLASATAARAALVFRPDALRPLLVAAAASFLLATLAWFHLLLPRTWRPAPPDEANP